MFVHAYPTTIVNKIVPKRWYDYLTPALPIKSHCESKLGSLYLGSICDGSATLSQARPRDARASWLLYVSVRPSWSLRVKSVSASHVSRAFEAGASRTASTRLFPSASIQSASEASRKGAKKTKKPAHCRGLQGRGSGRQAAGIEPLAFSPAAASARRQVEGAGATSRADREPPRCLELGAACCSCRL